jgi:integrase
MSNTRNWSRKSLDELRELYLDELAAELRADGIDPFDVDATTVTRRYRGLDYALGEHHDMTVAEFLDDICGLSDMRTESDSRFDAADLETREAIQSYLQNLETRGKLQKTTADANRTALAAIVDAYADRYGEADLVAGASGDRLRNEETERLLETFDTLEKGLAESTLIRYRDSLSRWYDAMADRGLVEFNPTDAVKSTFGWSRDQPDPKALAAADVRHLYDTADSLEESLLIIALAGWGLRPNEVASLHVSQVNLEPEDPHLAFDERKNGPGTVALLVGLEELAQRLDELGVDEDWNGYVFPSSQSRTGHISVGTVRNRFTDIVDRTEVTVDGESPVPKMGRRFWYQTYADAQSEMLELLEEIAGDQGSTSAQVVKENYLDEAQARELRRRAMRDALETVFD